MYRFLLYASNIIYKKCLSFWTAFFVSKEKIAPSLVSSLIAGLVSSMQCFLFIFLEKKDLNWSWTTKPNMSNLGFKNSEITCGLISAYKKLRLLFLSARVGIYPWR